MTEDANGLSREQVEALGRKVAEELSRDDATKYYDVPWLSQNAVVRYGSHLAPTVAAMLAEAWGEGWQSSVPGGPHSAINPYLTDTPAAAAGANDE